MSSVGYAFQVEMAYRAYRMGLRIVEIPITFTERTRGTSKVSMGIGLETMWRVLQLRFSRNIR